MSRSSERFDWIQFRKGTHDWGAYFGVSEAAGGSRGQIGPPIRPTEISLLSYPRDPRDPRDPWPPDQGACSRNKYSQNPYLRSKMTFLQS